ncbi:MAG: hypothetical protein ACTS47_02860 [Candidatus Hodgkinia cicadicola]
MEDITSRFDGFIQVGGGINRILFTIWH